tara:strand:+ start:6110 stop:7279 length:1170 start_codon:yes stop_codon:yes gene_type:complete
MTKRKQKQLKRQNRKAKQAKQNKAKPSFTPKLIITEGSENMACILGVLQAADLKEEVRFLLDRVSSLSGHKPTGAYSDTQVSEIVNSNPTQYSNVFKSSREKVTDCVKRLRNSFYNLLDGQAVGSLTLTDQSEHTEVDNMLSLSIAMLETLEDKKVRHFVSTSDKRLIEPFEDAFAVDVKESKFACKPFIFEFCTSTAQNKFVLVSFYFQEAMHFAIFNYRNEVDDYQIISIHKHVIEEGEEGLEAVQDLAGNAALAFYSIHEEMLYETRMYSSSNMSATSVYSCVGSYFLFRALGRVNELTIKQASPRSSQAPKPVTTDAPIEVCPYTKLDDFTTQIVSRKGIGLGATHASPVEHVRRAHERKYRDSSGNVVKIVEIAQSTINKGHVK